MDFGKMLVLPLLCAWPLCYLLIREICRGRGTHVDWRVAWMAASVAFGVILTTIVEVCSALDSLNRPTLFASWIVADIGLLAFYLKQRSRASFVYSQNDTQQTEGVVLRWSWEAKLLTGASAALIATLFAIALLTPTTNGDSLSYHLARMAHWIEQGSVKHFATDDTRQLEFGPWSSFVMTNLFLLWGNDRLLNLVQWFAMLSSAVGLTWIAEQLRALKPLPNGGGRSGGSSSTLAALTLVLAVTLPIGVVESVSTQNDYTTAFWLLCLITFAFCLLKNPANRYAMLGAGAACGLGVLTKATTYVYAAPLIAAGGLWWFWRIRGAPRMTGRFAASRSQLMLCFVLPFVAINLPHVTRNLALFHAPLGSSEIMKLERNERTGLAVAASNGIRNLALHASTGIPIVTTELNRALAALHRLTGQDLNEPSTTYENCPFQFQERFFIFDSAASCTFHVLGILLAMSLTILRFRQHRALLVYAVLVASGAAIFCALLKWQPWHSRLHLPWLLALIPLIAVVVHAWPKPVVAAVGVIALASGITTMAFNSSRPVLDRAFWRMPREMQYLALHDNDLREPLARLADKLVASKSASVGLKADFCGIEYPLWVMLRNRGYHGRFIRCHVQNVSAGIRTARGEPDVIVTVFNRMPEAVARAYPYSETYGRLFTFWPAAPNPLIQRAERQREQAPDTKPDLKQSE